MHPTTGTRRRRAGAAALAVAAALVAAACGHRAPTAELVAANSQVVERGSPTGVGAGAAGDVAAAGGTGEPAADAGGTGASAAGPPGDAGAGPGAAVAGGEGSGGSGGAAAGAAAGGGDAAPAVGTPGETGPVVIGSVGNYSGIAGPPQAPMARAVQIWAEYQNSKGGLFGRRIQVIVVDDRGDPAQHVAALRDLVENRKVVAFVSNAGALTIASGRSYLESVGVPVIGTACANTTEYESPVMFPQCPTLPTTFFSNIRTGVLYGGKKLAMFYCSEAQTCTDGYNGVVTSGAAEQAGAEVVYTARVSLAQPDFTSECRQAQAAGADMLFVLLDPTGVNRAAQSCARQGFNPLYAQGASTVFYDSKDRPGFERLVVAAQVFPFVGDETPARKEFQQVMSTFYGRPAGPHEAHGWVAAKLFELAATHAAEAAKSISPKTLLDALYGLRNETLGGLSVPLTFPRGAPDQPGACWFSAVAEDREWKSLNGGQATCR